MDTSVGTADKKFFATKLFDMVQKGFVSIHLDCHGFGRGELFEDYQLAVFIRN